MEVPTRKTVEVGKTYCMLQHGTCSSRIAILADTAVPDLYIVDYGGDGHESAGLSLHTGK